MPPCSGVKIAEISVREEVLIKLGIMGFHREIVEKTKAPILELPKRPNGTPLVQCKTFFTRMLQNRLEISNAMQSDISAAQPDLVHLSLEQLLSLRASTIDFFTDSESHRGHIGFLAKLAELVSEKLVKRLLVGTEDEERETCANVSADALRAVGVLVTRAYGEKERLEASQQPPVLPQCWALELKECDWLGRRYVLFNLAELWIKVVPIENVDFAAESKSQQLCVIRERSDHNRKDCVHHWEFFRVESTLEGVRETLVPRPRASMASRTKELRSVLEKCATVQTCASALGNAKELRGQMGRFCRSMNSLAVKPDPKLNNSTARSFGDLQESARFPSMPCLRPVGRRGTHGREVSEGPHHSTSANLEKQPMVELLSVNTRRKSASFRVKGVNDELFCNSFSEGRLSVSSMVRAMEENCFTGSTKSAVVVPTFNDPATDR